MMDPATRLAAARAAARELVDALESGTTMIAECLLKAQRLARIQRDSYAQTWIRLELSGYPDTFDSSELGWCAKYAWRFGPNDTVVERFGLPELEAGITGMQTVLNKLSGPAITEPVVNMGAATATLKVMDDATKVLVTHRNLLSQTIAKFQRLKAHVHSYATDVLIALELGDVAETLFEQSRARVDRFVSARCPEAAEQLLAVNDRLREDQTESRSAALNSCRRLIHTIADKLYPPSNTPYTDRGGRKREVGKEAYKNRLIAFIETRLAGGTDRILSSELNHLVERLDALYEKTCKGVHSQVSADEVRLVILQTYMFLGELAHIADDGLVAPKSQA